MLLFLRKNEWIGSGCFSLNAVLPLILCDCLFYLLFQYIEETSSNILFEIVYGGLIFSDLCHSILLIILLTILLVLDIISTLMPTDCSVLRTPTLYPFFRSASVRAKHVPLAHSILPNIRISWDYHPTFMLISTYEQAHVGLDLLTLASLKLLF